MNKEKQRTEVDEWEEDDDGNWNQRSSSAAEQAEWEEDDDGNWNQR